jgi:transposase, IS5 family
VKAKLVDSSTTQLDPGLDLSTKRTRKREFLDEMRCVVPWSKLIALIELQCPKGKTGRPPIAVATMLQIYFLHQWFWGSDSAMQEVPCDAPLYREFAGLDKGMTRLPDKILILRFRRLLQACGPATQMLAAFNEILSEKDLMLKAGSAAEAILIGVPNSTKSGSGERDPEMPQAKKGNQIYFVMKAHIGADAESGLVHTVIGAATNAHDINVTAALSHSQEKDVYADAGYQGIEKLCQTNPVRWHAAMRPDRRREPDSNIRLDAIYNHTEHLNAGVRAEVEHPFHVRKQKFTYIKTRYRGLTKNTAQITTLFALSNLCMSRGALSKA